MGDIEIYQTPRQKFYFCLELVGASLSNSVLKYYKLQKLHIRQRLMPECAGHLPYIHDEYDLE